MKLQHMNYNKQLVPHKIPVTAINHKLSDISVSLFASAAR